MKRFIPAVAIFVLLALLFVFATSPGYADVTDWESYRDTGYSYVWGGTEGEAFNSEYSIVYVAGSNFTAPTNAYKVGYYDGNNAKAATHTNPTLIGSTLLSQYALDTPPQTAAAGEWHAVVFDTAGAMPDTYAEALAHDDYVDFADDAFWVAASAIPEFPTVLVMIMALGLSSGVYYWMRQRYRRQVLTANSRR